MARTTLLGASALLLLASPSSGQFGSPAIAAVGDAIRIIAPGGVTVASSGDRDAVAIPITTEDDLRTAVELIEGAIDQVRTAAFNDNAAVEAELLSLRAANGMLNTSLQAASSELRTLRGQIPILASEIQTRERITVPRTVLLATPPPHTKYTHVHTRTHTHTRKIRGVRGASPISPFRPFRPFAPVRGDERARGCTMGEGRRIRAHPVPPTSNHTAPALGELNSCWPQSSNPPILLSCRQYSA